MTTTNALRTTWTAENIHITDERGSLPKGTYYCAVSGERWSGMKCGRFLIGHVIVEIAKGQGYRVALKNSKGERVLDTVLRDCPSGETLRNIVAQWVTEHKPERVINYYARRGIEL